MPSPEEISFARKRQDLNRSITECVFTAEQCFGIQCKSYSGSMDCLTGPLRGNTIAGQQFVDKWTWATPNGDISLEVAIGHTGPDWHPVITITTSDDFSTVFDLDQGDQSGFPARPCLVGQVRRISEIIHGV